LVHPGSDPGTEVKPWVKSTVGGRAEPRAVTRVNPEQASKGKMRVPIRPKDGEGRCGGRGGTETDALWLAGVLGTARGEGLLGNVGGPLWEAGRDCRRRKSRRPWRESERLMVPMKPVTTVEGRGLTSGCLGGGRRSGD